MTEGKEADFGLGKVNKGSFSLFLEMKDGKELAMPLSPLCASLVGSDPLVFRRGVFPLVMSDFNRDGISEFNIGQPGNSWGGHYLLFTFAGGTNEIQRDIIAMVGLGLPKSR